MEDISISDFHLCTQELPIVAREAVFLIAAATEEFTMRLAAAVERMVQRENRMTAQYKDVCKFSQPMSSVPAERFASVTVKKGRIRLHGRCVY